jgi:tryptophan synthase alpha chain
MSAIDDLFARLRSQGRKALMPFVTAGDPDLPTTAALVREMVRRGASLCEVGFPYSDPIADGPVVQASYTRSLANRIKLPAIVEMLAGVVPQVDAPLVAMLSFAIIFRHGPRQFVEEAKAAGLAGLIVPDLPVEESSALAALCRQQDLSLVQLITPTTPRERAVRIAEKSSGFIYYVSVAGITGERKELPADLVEAVAWLRQRTQLPVCIGFGISTPEHVRQLKEVADGLIVGSAIVRRIAQAGGRPREAVVQDVGQFVAELVAALA